MTESRRTIRSANALLVFEAAARRLSFSRAAEELHVTQVAVSRMIGRLEDSVGVKLFERARGGLTLTEDGALLQVAVTHGFGQMETALREIQRRRNDSHTVTLSVSSAFTSHWLMPRYARFQQEFPNISLRFEVLSRLQGPVHGVDLGLRLLDSVPASNSWHFCREVVIPACSPDYLGQRGELEDAGPHVLIHLLDTTIDWGDFCARTGLDVHRLGNTLSFTDGALVLEAAMWGRGIALAWISAASYGLRTEKLVAASERFVSTGREYRLISPPGPVRKEVAEVRDWLLAEMHADMSRLRDRYPFLSDVLSA